MKKIISITSASLSIALLSSVTYAADIQFAEVELPVESNEITISKKVWINGEKKRLKFDELFRTGQVDQINGEMYGLMKDYQGNPAVVDLGSTEPYVCSGNYDGVKGSGTDFTALLQKHGKKYMVSQFECQNGGMYTAELKQAENGKLRPVPGTLQFVDTRHEWGGWVHCAGSVTPWKTYLGGEEYEPDANALEHDPTGSAYYSDKVDAYWLGDYDKSSPYHNGWITEVDILTDGKSTFAKHYAMGRFSHELGYVMPDRRTTYLTDDGTNDTLFMFVANTPRDLSRGTLYAARWNQTSGIGGGSAYLNWINLGYAESTEIKAAIAKGIKFSDMFEQDTDNCQWIGASGIPECLAVKPGMEILASRLESRRYAALLGATHEFRKMEGFTFAPERGQAYIAISEIGRGMLAASENDPEKGKNYDDLDTGMVVTGDHIQVDQADYCGAIYSMDVNRGIKDSDGNRIRSQYVTVNMNTLLHSNAAPGSSVSPEECATSNNDLMAQPDNISMIRSSNTLIIGEDGKHDNNMVWSFNLDTDELTRIVTVPAGAETTSPYLHQINGETYMTLIAQHPDKSSSNAYGDTVTGVIRMKDIKGY